MAEILDLQDPSMYLRRCWRGSPWNSTDSEQPLQPGGSLLRPAIWAGVIRRLSIPENIYHRPLTYIHITVSVSLDFNQLHRGLVKKTNLK